ncbi:hypothetical protein HNR42_003326 [Deinobacterium chartae]|uniref:Uncharacterized protein n=1 Tax=Deinobacterium chartae TaxID=521158 RepID=A0A841I4B5_9DEIO|nr:hypothetical protein [Deinobacterium chartae]MBB6099866.1 hypothetical protein [Deinobacterium chartae]
MGYRKLSDQVRMLKNPQRSDVFVRLFRTAVREGRFDAAYLPERFELPKVYARRDNAGESYRKDARDMVFEVSPDFERWFAELDSELNSSKRRRRIKPSLEAYEQGLIDFRAAAEETRRKMMASQEKGQKLGRSRGKTRRATRSPGAEPAAQR